MRETRVSRAPSELLGDISVRLTRMRRNRSDLGLGAEGSLRLSVAGTVILTSSVLSEVNSFGRAQVFSFARCAARKRGGHFCKFFAATVSSRQGNASAATFCFPLAALDE